LSNIWEFVKLETLLNVAHRMSSLKSGDTNLKILSGIGNMQRIDLYLKESLLAEPDKKSIEKIIEIRSVQI